MSSYVIVPCHDAYKEYINWGINIVQFDFFLLFVKGAFIHVKSVIPKLSPQGATAGLSAVSQNIQIFSIKWLSLCGLSNHPCVDVMMLLQTHRSMNVTTIFPFESMRRGRGGLQSFPPAYLYLCPSRQLCNARRVGILPTCFCQLNTSVRKKETMTIFFIWQVFEINSVM